MSKRSHPKYDDYNRIDTGLAHVDSGRASYTHIPSERWREIFGPKSIGGDSRTRREQTDSSQESKAS